MRREKKGNTPPTKNVTGLKKVTKNCTVEPRYLLTKKKLSNYQNSVGVHRIYIQDLVALLFLMETNI